MKPTPILLDVDAGVDDTLAVIFALLTPHLNVKAITTVAGNVPVHLCTRNVLLTLELLSPRLRSIPVVAEGAAKPLHQKLFTAREVHGEDGIGNASRFYPKPKVKAVHEDAVDLILKTVRCESNITLVATGPLTNVARALTKDFATMKRVREIIVMGGAFGGAHNTGPVSEFNFYTDPDAADIVMRSGLPTRLIPLNVTEQCIMTPADVHSMNDDSLRRFMLHFTKFYFDFHKRTAGFNGGFLHDPLAVAAAAKPSLLHTELGYVHVETGGKYTRGMSVFFPSLNVRNEAQLPQWVLRALRRPPTTRVAVDVDAKSFVKEFFRALEIG